MRQQEVFNKIGSILNELNEQYEYLNPLAAPLDDLELELFAANANFLSDHLEILRKLNAALNKTVSAPKNEALIDPLSADDNEIKTPELKPVVENDNDGENHEDHNEIPDFEFDLTTNEATTIAEPEQHLADDIAYLEDEPVKHKDESSAVDPEVQNTPVPHIDLSSDAGRDHFSFIRSTEPDIIRHDLELNEADTYDEDENTPHEQTVAEALAEISAPETVSEPEMKGHETAIDTALQEKPLTLNERMSAQITGQQHSASVQPITDLKSAITLNDKMLFVRDLFNGYSLAYSEAIEILNRFNKLEDAKRFLSVNYEVKNNWADKPATHQKFYELLERRFA